MANFIGREKQIQILRLLVEGNSIRSTERITGISRERIMRTAGPVRRRLPRIPGSEPLQPAPGARRDRRNLDVRPQKATAACTALRSSTRRSGTSTFSRPSTRKRSCSASFAIGKRNHFTTQALIADLSRRMVRPPVEVGSDRPQLSTDGWQSYPSTIREEFGQTVRHGILIKQYRNPESGRYAPPDLTGTERIAVQNITDVSTICTSHVECHNLTLRTFMRRFTRLTVGFSKKLPNLAAAVALQVAYYNFCWRLRRPGKSGQLTPDPCDDGGSDETLWTHRGSLRRRDEAAGREEAGGTHGEAGRAG